MYVAKSDGYDEYYILLGSKQLEVEDVQMSDDLVGVKSQTKECLQNPLVVKSLVVIVKQICFNGC